NSEPPFPRGTERGREGGLGGGKLGPMVPAPQDILPARRNYAASLEKLGTGHTLRRLLVHVDLVPIQILKRHTGAIWLNLRLAVEFHAGLLHSAVLGNAVIGHDPEERLRTALLADQRPVFVRFSQIQGDGYDLIVR